MSARRAKRRQVALMAQHARRDERQARYRGVITPPALEGELVEPLRLGGYQPQTGWGRMPLEGEYAVPLRPDVARVLLAMATVMEAVTDNGDGSYTHTLTPAEWREGREL